VSPLVFVFDQGGDWMRRVIASALALALLPAAAFAQNPPAQQQPPAQEPAQPAQPAAPKLTFSTPAGLLLVQIKPDQTAVFEEMVTKLKSNLAASTDMELKNSTAGFKIYKAAEPMAGNALYVVLIDPVTANSEYDFFMLMQKTMTPEQLRDPVVIEDFKKWSGAFAAGYNKLTLTPLGG
jgi:hypothetical protein